MIDEKRVRFCIRLLIFIFDLVFLNDFSEEMMEQVLVISHFCPLIQQITEPHLPLFF